jgi:hypothetical protein
MFYTNHRYLPFRLTYLPALSLFHCLGQQLVDADRSWWPIHVIHRYVSTFADVHCRRHSYILILALACFVFAQLHAPGANVWQTINVNFFLAFWSVSISTTVFITTMIVGRLMFMRARLRLLTNNSHGSPYLSVSAMLIESAALYSAWALAFIISFGANHWFQNIALPVVAQVEVSRISLTWPQSTVLTYSDT